MSKNFVQPARELELTAPGGGVTSGGGLMIGGLLVVAAVTADATERFTGNSEGAFDLPKNTAVDFTEGELMFWDDSNKRFDKSASGFFPAGTALEDTAGSAPLVKAKLDGNAVVAVV